jgi:hypothetical protein
VSISWLLHVAAMPLQTHAQWRGHEVNLATAVACAATLPWTQVGHGHVFHGRSSGTHARTLFTNGNHAILRLRREPELPATAHAPPCQVVAFSFEPCYSLAAKPMNSLAC